MIFELSGSRKCLRFSDLEFGFQHSVFLVNKFFVQSKKRKKKENEKKKEKNQKNKEKIKK